MAPRPPRPAEEVAREFVETSGFPQEVRVVDAFHQAGFAPLPALVYDDPSSGEVGEIDIFAYRESLVPGATFRLSYLVECKRSVDIPWLLFRSPPGGASVNPDIRSITLMTSRGMVMLLHAYAPDWKERLRITRGLTGIASRVRIAKPGEDVAYKAVSGALRAARAQVTSTSRQHEQAGLDGTPIPFEIAVPVVVTGAPLFFCDFEPNGQFALHRTEQGTVLATSTSPSLPRTVLLDVVTEAGLAAYVAEQQAVADQLLEVLRDPLEREAALVARERERRNNMGMASPAATDRPRT